MAKKCIICEEEAKYNIKGTSDYYCDECAKENFSDITLLQKIEEQAKIIKDLIKEKENNIKDDEGPDSKNDEQGNVHG